MSIRYSPSGIDCFINEGGSSAADSSLLQKIVARTKARLSDPGLFAETAVSGISAPLANSTLSPFESYFRHRPDDPAALHLFRAEDIAGHRHLIHLAVLTLVCGIVGALVVWLLRQRLESEEHAAYLYIKAFKLAFKVGLSSCIIAAISASLGTFHVVSSGITVMIVMEMGTVDRLLVKGLLRSMGTVIGAAEAMGAIKLVELGKRKPVVVFLSILMVSVTNAMLQRLQPKQAYMYLASNITFVFVYYGYWIEGAKAISTRVTSVFVAVVVAFVVDLLWPLVWLDSMWFSVNNVISATEKVLRKTFAIIDFTFVHDEILAQEGDSDTLVSTLWKDRLFLPETVDFFQMQKKDLTLGYLKSQLNKNAHGKRVANEADIAALHAEAKNAWDDIQFTYWLIRRRPPRDYLLLFDPLHSVYAQACSLSHMAYSSLSSSGRAVWHSSSNTIEALRKAICELQPPLLKLLVLCNEGNSTEVDAQVVEIIDILEQAVQSCDEAVEEVQSSCQQDRWRFEAFIMCVELLLAELSTYVRTLLENFGTHAESPITVRQICNEATRTPTAEILAQYDSTSTQCLGDLRARLVRLSRHADL